MTNDYNRRQPAGVTHPITESNIHGNPEGNTMGEQGKRDKGKKEQKKQPKLTLKEKRQAKKNKAATKDYTA